MKAIFTGTLAGGFALQSVVKDGEVTDIVADNLSYGRLSEAMDVYSPSNRNKRTAADEEGTHFVVYDRGLSNGNSVFGPFIESDVAEEFAEDNRNEDEEWEIFSLETDN